MSILYLPRVRVKITSPRGQKVKNTFLSGRRPQGKVFLCVVRERVALPEKVAVADFVIRAKTVSDIEIILFALNSYLFSAYGKNIILQNIFFRIR